MKKHLIGAAINWNDPETGQMRRATVIRHGHDRCGIYTEIKTEDDGETYRVHRTSLQTTPQSPTIDHPSQGTATMTKTNLTALIDAYGLLKAKQAELESEERALKKALSDLDPGAYEGEKYRLSVSESVRETPDEELKEKTKEIVDAYRATLSAQYLRAHTVKTPVRSHRVSARNGDVA